MTSILLLIILIIVIIIISFLFFSLLFLVEIQMKFSQFLTTQNNEVDKNKNKKIKFSNFITTQNNEIDYICQEKMGRISLYIFINWIVSLWISIRSFCTCFSSSFIIVQSNEKSSSNSTNFLQNTPFLISFKRVSN